MPPSEPTTTNPQRRTRRLLLALAGTGLGLLAVLATVVIGLETPWGMTRAVRLALGAANPWPGTQLTLGDASGGFFTGLRLHHLRLARTDGFVLASIETLEVSYDVPLLLGQPTRVYRLRVAGPAVFATRRPSGTFDLAEPFAGPPKGKPGAGFSLDRLEVTRGTIALIMPALGRDSVLRVESITARLSRLAVGKAPTLILDTLSAILTAPAPPATHLRVALAATLSANRFVLRSFALEGSRTHGSGAGTVALALGTPPRFDGTNLRIRLSPLAGEDIARFLPAAGDPGDLTLDASARGDHDALVLDLDARARRGGHAQVAARVSGPGGPFELRTRGRIQGLDVGALRGGARDSLVVDADWSASLAGPKLETVSGPFALSLAGSRAETVRLEVAKIAGRFLEGRAAFDLAARGAGVDLAARGDSRPFERAPEYALKGTLGVPPDLTRPRDAAGAPDRARLPFYAGDITFSFEGKGVSPDSALARARIELRPAPGSGSLFGPGTLDLALERGLARWRTDLVAASGTLRAAGDLTLGPVPTYHLTGGEIRALDLAAFAGDTVPSRLDARFHAEGRGFDPRTAKASADLQAVTLSYGPHRLADASASVRVERGHATLEASGNADEAGIQAHGALASLTPLRDARLEASVRGLDLAHVTSDTALVSDLGLRLECQIEDPARLASTHGSAHIECAPSPIGRQRVEKFQLDATLQSGTLALRGRFASTFGRGSLTATARPFDEVPGLRIDPLTIEDVNLAAVPGLAAPPTNLTGTLVAAVTGRELAALRADARVTLDGSRVQDVTLDRFATTARLVAGRLDAELDVRNASDRASVSLQGEPFSDPLRLTTRGDLDVPDLARWLGRDSLAAGVALTFDAGFTMPRADGLAGAVASMKVEGRGQAGEVRVDTISAAVRLARGVAQVDRLALRGNVLHLDGSGRVALPNLAVHDSTSFRLTGVLLDPEPLATWFGGAVTTARGGEFWLTADGPASATRLAGGLTAGGPHLGTSWADSVSLEFKGQTQDSLLARLDARLEVHRLVVSLLRPRDLAATVVWDGRALDLDAHSDVDAGRYQRVALRLEPTRDGVRGRLERFEAQRRGSLLSLAHPVEFEFGKQFRVDSLVLLDDGVPTVHASGGIPEQGEADLQFGIDSLDVTDVFDLIGFETLAGRLTASGSLTGTREHPLLRGSLRSRLVAGKGKPATVTGELRCAEGSAVVTLTFDQTPTNRLALTATLPVALNLTPRPGVGPVTRSDQPMSARLEAKRFALAWFAPLVSPRIVRQPRGWLDGTVTADGDPDSPSLAGSLTLDDARAELPGLGATYDRAHARFEFADRTVRLVDAGVRSGGGKLAAKGELALKGRDRKSLNLTATFKKFVAMNTDQAKAAVSGEIGLSGRVHTLALRGHVEALETTIYAEGVEARRVEPVTLTRGDRIQLLERFGVDLTADREDSHSPADSVDVDVTLSVGHNVWVRRHSDPVLALELRGKARVRKPVGGAIDARGDLGIRTGRSYLSFVGRRFDINRAEVTLPGSLDSARAELAAVYQPSASTTGEDILVRAAVTIDASGVETRLSSQPYLDQSALLNYLVTGQVQGGMQSGAAYGLALGTALGAVGGAAGRSLGLDVVQVTMDAYGGQTLSAGSYVDPRVYLGFRQPVVEGQHTSSTTGSTPATEFEVEFEAGKKLLFNLQGSSTQYRFFLKPRLGR